MRKFLIAILLMNSIVTSYAASINKIIFFGDSLSDNGNLYKLSMHIVPKSPPYYEGRFSNGPTWAEFLGKYYYDKNYSSYSIYALGGATAIFHKPSNEFISPTTLDLEVNNYLLDNLFKYKGDTLYVIWIGANDYMFEPDLDPSVLTGMVINKINWAMQTLTNNGAKHFLILNLPDASRTPYIANSDSSAKIHTMILLHNQKLDMTIKNFRNAHPEVTLAFVNIYDLFNDLIDHPDKYNQRYHVNITSTYESCWKGGYFIKKTNTFSYQENTRAISTVIQANPDLALTYATSKSYEEGNVPCANAQNYLFWDAIHPTQTIHRILAQFVEQTLDHATP